MNIGYLRQDDDGHWYLVPENEIADFEEARMWIEVATNEGWFSQSRAIEKFLQEFDKHRLSGGVGQLKVIIE